MDTLSDNSTMQWLQQATPDAAITAITAIIVFAIGGFAKWLYDRHKDNAFLVDLLAITCDHLRSLITLIDKRIAGFQELASISPATRSDFSYIKVSIPADFLLRLPQIDLFRAMRRGRKRGRLERIKSYPKLIEAITFLSEEPDISENQFRYFTSNQSQYMREYVDAANELVRMNREFLASNREAGKRPSEDEFESNLNTIVASWARMTDKDDVDRVFSSLITPILDLCVANQNDTRRVPLLAQVNKAQVAKANRDRLLTLFGDYFKDEIAALATRRNILLDMLKIFENSVATA